MIDAGGNKDAVSQPDLGFAPIETDDHRALEHDLLVLDVVVAVARYSSSGIDAELTGDEVRDAALRSQEHLHRGAPAPRDGDRFDGILIAHHSDRGMAHLLPPWSCSVGMIVPDINLLG